MQLHSSLASAQRLSLGHTAMMQIISTRAVSRLRCKNLFKATQKLKSLPMPQSQTLHHHHHQHLALEIPQHLRNKGKSLFMLHVLAALYGSGTAVSEMSDHGSSEVPESLNSLVRSIFALPVFLPVLPTALRDRGVVLAGLELGFWGLLRSILGTYKANAGVSNEVSLIFGLTVLFLPILMQFSAGRSVSRFTWMTSIVSILDLGILEEEGAGWSGISVPKLGNFWAILDLAISGIQMLRSEALFGKLNGKELNATSLTAALVLNTFWEIINIAISPHGVSDFVQGIHGFSWCPAVYSGLVCAGICSLLECCSLGEICASTATSVYMTIPVWGAFFCLLPKENNLTDLALLCLSVGGFASMCTHMTILKEPGKHEIRSRIAERDIPETKHQAKNTAPILPPTDHLCRAILTCQLKLPYYASQAQRVFGEIDYKVKSFYTESAGSLDPSAANQEPQNLIMDNADAAEKMSSASPAADWIELLLKHTPDEILHTNPVQSLGAIADGFHHYCHLF